MSDREVLTGYNEAIAKRAVNNALYQALRNSQYLFVISIPEYDAHFVCTRFDGVLQKFKTREDAEEFCNKN